MDRHMPLVVGASLVLLVAVALLLFGGGSSRGNGVAATPPAASSAAASPAAASFAAVPVQPASPSAPVDPSASPSVPGCTQGAFPVLTGDDMPAPVDVDEPAPLVRRVDVGVYTTSPNPPLEASEGFQIWGVRHGTGIRRIGFSPDRAKVDDLSADASFAVVSVDHPRLGPLDCFDLVTIATDGSGARWIAASVPAAKTLGARLSPVGRWVAYTEVANTAATGGLELRDLWSIGPGESFAVPCSPSSPDEKAWSPDGLHLVAVCGSDLVIVDTHGTADRFPLPSGDAIQALAWSSPTTLNVAMRSSGNGPLQVMVWRLDITRSTSDPDAFTKRWTSTPQVTLARRDGASNLSPTGDKLVAQVMLATEIDASLDVIDLRSGRARELSGSDASDAAMQAGGSTDAGRVSLVASGGLFRPPSLDGVDLGSLKHTSYGTLPREYDQGLWRLP